MRSAALVDLGDVGEDVIERCLYKVVWLDWSAPARCVSPGPNRQLEAGVCLRLQLGDLGATAIFNKVVAVPPGGAEELGTLHNDLGEMDACTCLYLLGEDVDAGTQAKYETAVFPVENNVPPPQEAPFLELTQQRCGLLSRQPCLRRVLAR